MKVSVIVCTYSVDLLHDTIECINSLLNQDYHDFEILLVMDRNETLFNLLKREIPNSVKILINEIPGLSSARNTGISHSQGDILVFIDDDATAAPDFIKNLVENYKDPSVIGAGGKIIPKSKPNYPEELYWIGGYTYKGYPESKCAVRNVHGCNMSFRKEVFSRVGLFDPNLGRVGKKLVTAEETEFSLRVISQFPESKIIYDPSVVVFHKVHDYREKLKYAIKRGYFEGKSKYFIKRKYTKKDTIIIEDKYLEYLLRKTTPIKINNIFSGREVSKNFKDLIWIFFVIGSVGFGFIQGKYTK